MRECLPMLNAKPKWTQVVADIRQRDVVLALDSNLPRFVLFLRDRSHVTPTHTCARAH